MDDERETDSPSESLLSSSSVSDSKLSEETAVGDTCKTTEMPPRKPSTDESFLLTSSAEGEMPSDDSGLKVDDFFSCLKLSTKQKLERKGKSAFSKYVPKSRYENVCLHSGSVKDHEASCPAEKQCSQLEKVMRMKLKHLTMGENEKQASPSEQIDVTEADKSWKSKSRPEKTEAGRYTARKRLKHTNKTFLRQSYLLKQCAVDGPLHDWLSRNDTVEQTSSDQPHWTARYHESHGNINKGHPSIIELSDFLRSEKQVVHEDPKAPLLTISKKQLYSRGCGRTDGNAAEAKERRCTILPSRLRSNRSSRKWTTTMTDDSRHFDAQNALSVVPMYVDGVQDCGSSPQHSLNPSPEPVQLSAQPAAILEYPIVHSQSFLASDRMANALLSPRWNSALPTRRSSNSTPELDFEQVAKENPGATVSELPLSTSSRHRTFIALGSNGATIVSCHLQAKGWKRITDPNCGTYNLKWAETRNQINYRAFQEGEQMVNHLPSSCHLSNKIRLVILLRELNFQHRPGLMKMSDIIPDTYRLDLSGEFELFCDNFRVGETWICKPACLNQGKGIFLVRHPEDIIKRLNVNNPPKMPLRILQRYISEPLLLEGRKADIRSYMLIASTSPFVILFNSGYVRLSCSNYNVDSCDMRTHLTNQYMQKKDPRYSSMKEDTIWSMNQLNEYVNRNIAPARNVDSDWVFNSFMAKMRRVMLHCFLAARNKLECRVGYFELLGFDFLIDNNLKVWLIEINVNPSFSTNCKVLREVIPPMIQESLDIALECFEKNCCGVPLLPLQSTKCFSLLYCGERAPTWPVGFSVSCLHHHLKRLIDFQERETYTAR